MKFQKKQLLDWKTVAIALTSLVLIGVPLFSGLSTTSLVLIYVGLIFFATMIYMLYWSIGRGHFRDLEAQSRMIFDQEEPEGRVLESTLERRQKEWPNPADPSVYEGRIPPSQDRSSPSQDRIPGSQMAPFSQYSGPVMGPGSSEGLDPDRPPLSY